MSAQTSTCAMQSLEWVMLRKLQLIASPNITQPNTLNSGAEFDAAPMRLRGGSDANSGGSIFLALPVLAP